MKKLFLVDGAAGYVKEDLIKYINSKENIGIVKKYTTKEEKNNSLKNCSDLVCISDDKFIEMESESECYCYNYGNKDDGYGKARYGIPKDKLRYAIEKFDNVFVIVRSSECTNEIIKDVGNKVKVIPVLIYPDKQYTNDRINNDEKFDDVQKNKELEARPKRINEVLQDYFKELNFFNRTILLSDASEEHLHMQLNQLVSYCDKEPNNMLFVDPNQSYQLIKPLVGYKKDIVKKLSESSFEKNIFLMMKYRDNDSKGKYTNTNIYKLICQVVSKRGFNCVRAD